MKETLQHEEATQCIGISTTGLGDHRSHGPIAGHALTFKLDHSSGAGLYLLIECGEFLVGAGAQGMQGG